jgi:hypothetical protein
MFEDSLVESTGRIRTRSSRYAAGSFVLETALVAVIILIPYLYPDALPRKFLRVPLIAPPPAPAAPVAEQPAASASRPRPLVIDMTVPTVIPHGPVQIIDNPPGPVIPGTVNLGSPNGPIPPPPPAPSTSPAESLPDNSSSPSNRATPPSPSPHAPREPSWSPPPSPPQAASRASASSAVRPCSYRPPSTPFARPVTAPGNSTASPSRSKPPSMSSSPSAAADLPPVIHSRNPRRPLSQRRAAFR